MEITKLTATNGMILTNGEAYGVEVFLGNGDSVDNWHEITMAEYEAIMNADEDNTATDADYQEALREMGVKV